MVATLEEIKEYVRIDSIGEDDFLLSLCATSESLCSDILHRKFDEMEEVPDPVKTAVLYGISYLYENREQADFRELTLMLKCLLFGQRIEVF
ncbi:head-tail connector protein [Lacrimispora celerecrescens]|uniref:head-tail connector protein n=1 Tax=Lacrimispora celerecrescens TaxID=29354 RepID=UPI001648501F|nr:head-tail connector protein [Lacrimispora celerecrescens]